MIRLARVMLLTTLASALLLPTACSSAPDMRSPEDSTSEAAPSLDPAQTRGAAGKAAMNARIESWPTTVTPQDAFLAVQAFDPSASGLRIDKHISPRSRDPKLAHAFYQVATDDGRVFIVEQTSGNVTEVWGRIPLAAAVDDTSTVSPPLSEDDALALAQMFLAQVRPGFEFMTPYPEAAIMAGDDPSWFQFGWALIDENGLRLRDEVRISVDPQSGTLRNYRSVEGWRIDFPTAPSLTATEAMAAAGISEGSTMRPELLLVRTPGKSHLAWIFGGRQGGWVSWVDAHTGEVLDDTF